MRVTLPRLVVCTTTAGPQKVTGGTGPVLHILVKPGGLTLCGDRPGSSDWSTWRPATPDDRELHRCTQCMQVERSTQAGERMILRAMGRVGFR